MKNDFNLVQLYYFLSLHTHKMFMRKCSLDMMKYDLFSVLEIKAFYHFYSQMGVGTVGFVYKIIIYARVCHF